MKMKKGKIQEVIDYRDGSTLKLSTAKWYSPDGTDIDEKGIKPDFFVDLSESDYENNNDPQLKKALSLIN